MKVFKTIFDGSLYGQFEPTVVFLAMLVIAEREGIVDMTPQAIAARCGYPLDIVLRGIAELEKPDPKSRTPDDEGRRITRLEDTRDWGWRITNYEKYDKIRTAEERREYFRQKKAEYRARDKVSTMSTMSTMCPQCPPESTSSSSSSSSSSALTSDSESEKTNVEPKRSTAPGVEEVFEHWKAEHGHPRAQLDRKRRAKITEALKLYTVEQLRYAISGYLHSPHHMGTDPKGTGTRYDDIELFLRDAKHIDAGIRMFSNPPQAPGVETAGDRLMKNLSYLENNEAIEHDPAFPALSRT